jgi:hypothetical protein
VPKKSNIAKVVDKVEEPKKEEVVDTREPEDVLFEKLPILHKLVNATEILPETRQELTELLKKKKMTKKDRVIVEDILVNLYINTEMFKSDNPLQQEVKKAEIAELLNKI